MTQKKKKTSHRYHADLVKGLEKAKRSCEALSIRTEYRKPELSLSYGNLLEELVAMLDYVSELKQGL